MADDIALHLKHGGDVGFPTLTAYEHDGPGEFRRDRLLIVAGFLRARLSEREFGELYRLHDHKGHLTAGFRCSRTNVDFDKVEADVAAAWEAVWEYSSDVHFASPGWT